MQNKKAYEHSHHRFTGFTRHSRTQMVLTASFAISPVIGLSCHRRLARLLAKLDAGVEASGPHDFAVRFALFVISTSASIASRPAFVTIASRPSVGRDGGAYEVICAKRERKCFCK
jgi:hypothetical protein